MSTEVSLGFSFNSHKSQDLTAHTHDTPLNGNYENIPFSLRTHGVFVSWSLLSGFSIHRRKMAKEGKFILIWEQLAYQWKGSCADGMARTPHRGNHTWWTVNSQKYSGGVGGHCGLTRDMESTFPLLLCVTSSPVKAYNLQIHTPIFYLHECLSEPLPT